MGSQLLVDVDLLQDDRVEFEVAYERHAVEIDGHGEDGLAEVDWGRLEVALRPAELERLDGRGRILQLMQAPCGALLDGRRIGQDAGGSVGRGLGGAGRLGGRLGRRPGPLPTCSPSPSASPLSCVIWTDLISP